ncbi:MAG: hypothetical protein J6Y24_13620 [Bacteroidales bacterium]|nr:hypothetical protein [Bacteroidales bacterium]
MDSNIIIDKILIPSLYKLYEMDYINILYDVSERNICARLAHHMENIMRDYDRSNNCNDFYNYYADVEYDRMDNGKRKCHENAEELPQVMVSDLLIHGRNSRLPNLLAVEMKKRGRNNIDVDKDKFRLAKLVSKNRPTSDNCVFGTLIGAFITYSKKGVTICQFEDREGHGEQVAEIKYCYNTGMCQLEYKSFESIK